MAFGGYGTFRKGCLAVHQVLACEGCSGLQMPPLLLLESPGCGRSLAHTLAVGNRAALTPGWSPSIFITSVDSNPVKSSSEVNLSCLMLFLSGVVTTATHLDYSGAR